MDSIREKVKEHEHQLDSLCTEIADILAGIYGEPISRLEIRFDDVKPLHRFTWQRDI